MTVILRQQQQDGGLALDGGQRVVVGLAIEPHANRQAKGHYGMALGWLKRGRVKQAILSLEQALVVDPTYLEVYLELGRILLQQRRWRDLNALCQRGLRYFLEIPELHKLMMTALEEHGSLDDAYACYDLVRRDSRCLDIQPDEILCCVTVRNERVRLPWFLDYYRRLGVDRFFFIDNGSDDGSDDWLLAQPDVHIWTSGLAFKRANFGSAWFELLLRRHGVGHWCLTVDVDEFLLFEGAPGRTVRDFCRDLDRRGLRAATGVLLDMYSDRPIRETHYREGDDPLVLCPYFDRAFYHRRFPQCFQYRNQTIYFGGVRQRVFPAEHDYLLSKCVVLRYEPDVVLTPGQHMTNIAEPFLAKEWTCLLHFKFFTSFHDYAQSEARREVHAMGAEQYKAYDRRLAEQPDLTLFDPARSVRFAGTAQLRELGVLEPEPPPAPDRPAIAPVTIDAAEPRPFWSVMITVYDRIENLARVLPGVLAQARDDMQIEVLCDGGDAARQRAAAAEVERLGGGRVGFHAPGERLGHPRVFNRCLERATGRWVHILHDDDWLEPGFYDALGAVIDANPEAGAAFCQQRIAHQGAEAATPWTSWVERETSGLVDDWLGRIAVECRVQFSAMAVRRSVYEALGGFCADARSAFDWEMWIRIAAGYSVLFVPEVLVNIGRDTSAESSGLANSGKQVRDALAAIDLAAACLPCERAASLGAKARDRIAAYAMEVAERCLARGDSGAALANLRAAVAGRPSPRTLRALGELLQGETHVFRG